MHERPLVSVIIPTRNRREKLIRCVNSVLRSTWKEVEVVVVDDASDYDVGADFDGRVRVVRNSSRRLLGYSRNAGAEQAKGALLFFLDDDNVVDPFAVQAMADVLSPGGPTAVCAPVIYTLAAPDRVWTSYIRMGRFPGFYVLGVQQPKGIVETFSFHDAFMVKSEVFRSLGGFDASNFPIHFGELDFAYRLHLSGYGSVVTPEAKVWHDVGRAHMHVDSVRSFYTLRNRIILLRRYEDRSDLRFYLACVLPPLTVYYMVHHLTSVIQNRWRATFNLLRGVVSGITAPVRPFEASSTWSPTETTSSAGEDHPLVSVIIPTRNSARTIGQCLGSIEAQTYPEVEIIVVDNHSEDGTLDVAATYPRVRVFEGGPERGAQLNEGAKHARGRYLYRVDSDFVVGQTVVEEAVSKCLVGGFRVVTVHNTSDPRYGFWAEVRKLERDCYVDDDSHIAARFFDRSLFESVGGFDPALIAAEDYDLHNRLRGAGYAVGRIEAGETHIGEPRSLRDVVLKHVFYGTKISEFISKTPREVWVRELSPVRVAYARHWRAFFRDPKVTVGFALYQYVRFASAAAGYASSLF